MFDEVSCMIGRHAWGQEVNREVLFTATATHFDGTPISGATVTFSHLSNFGSTTELAKVRADSSGQATYTTSSPRRGSIIVDVTDPGVPQTETQLAETG